MSFCYARIEGNELFIAADMKFTTDNIDMTRRHFGDIADNMKKYGIIKNIIINDNICIAFAGNNILLANELLSKIDWNSSDMDLIISEANVIHQNATDTNDIEFIIAYADCNIKKLIQIKGGMTKELDECYIGSKEVYEAMINKPVEDISEDESEIEEDLLLRIKLEDRFKEVLKENVDDTVGEDSVFVRYCKKENKFKYNERYETNTGLKPQTVPLGEAICFDVSAADGGCTTTFYGDEKNAIHKYFKQIDKNICYYRGYIKDGKCCYLYLPRFEEEDKA